jgi:integrase
LAASSVCVRPVARRIAARSIIPRYYLEGILLRRNILARVAVRIPPLEIGRFMGHAKVTTTLTVYTHLFADDHSDAMAALGAMATPKPKASNVIPLHG